MKLPTTIIDKTIAEQGFLPAFRSTYTRRNTKLYGPRSLLLAEEMIAAKFAKPGSARPRSQVVVIGQAPNGFGKQILWHPDDQGLAVLVFLNAGDSLGVMISGVKRNDTIEFVNAAGIASFAEETKNKGAAAFIGVVAAGATVAASSFGAPELAPVIGAAAKFAETQFEEEKVKTKVRDPFGEDPASGGKARAEGGVIVSLPEARQIFYSGNSDHQERWIKKPGTRVLANYPDHIKGKGAYFLKSGSRNKLTAAADGDIILVAWDHAFQDNFGFYRLNVLLKRG